MSRVANAPVAVPSGVDVKVDGQALVIKGSKGELEMDVHPAVEVVRESLLLYQKEENKLRGWR